jgi:hypothetical protein
MAVPNLKALMLMRISSNNSYLMLLIATSPLFKREVYLVAKKDISNPNPRKPNRPS